MKRLSVRTPPPRGWAPLRLGRAFYPGVHFFRALFCRELPGRWFVSRLGRLARMTPPAGDRPNFSQPGKGKLQWGGEARSVTRHVPRSQPPFSFILAPGQRRYIIYIYCGLWCLYLPFKSDSFCLLPNQNFENNPQDPADPAETWIQDPSEFSPIFMVFKSFHQRNPPVI